MAQDGRYTALNLGPRVAKPGHAPLNLGVAWDVNPPEPPDPVIRGLRSTLRSSWAQAPQRHLSSRVGWAKGAPASSGAASAWSTAAMARAASHWSWAGAPQVSQMHLACWHPGMPDFSVGWRSPWGAPPLERNGVRFSWQLLGMVRHDRAARWQGAPVRALGRAGLAWTGDLPEARPERVTRWGHPAPTRLGRRLPWGPARLVPWNVLPPPKPPVPDPDPAFPSGRFVALQLGCALVATPGLVPLNLGTAACYVVRPRRRTYVVINELSMVRIPDRTPVEITSVEITTSVDSWGSTFNIELADPTHLALLKPTAAGPRQIEVALNGYTWTAIVESYGKQREFGRVSVTLTGRSRTALLAAPYAPARAKVAGEARSMAQLVAEELLDTGYEAAYSTVDWVVPGGAWFYDGSAPLDAISALAAASGAVVQSDPADRRLVVRPRYPASPWNWRNTTPDHQLVEDIIISEGLQVQSQPLYDAVVVTGELEGKGVTCKVRRAGSAGDLYAPQVSSPLISEAAAGAERGRNILSDRGEQAAIEVVLPLFALPLKPGETGRVLPLDLVQVSGEEGTWYGLCIAARWVARSESGRVVVEQTITLERHYSDAN